MNISLTKPSDDLALIKVEVQENDYADKVKSELKKIAATANIPGFRKGHVPMDQIKKRFGKSVKSDVLNNEVFNSVINYIREEKLHVLGEPMPVEVKEINLDDKDYTFEYEIGLAPELDVVVDKSVELPYYKIEVSDSMIDEQDKNFRERLGKQEPGEEADERAVIKGSIMQLNEDGTVNTNEGAIQVIAGIVAPFLFKDKEEAKKFLGKKVNDKVVFNPYKTCEGNPVELASMLNIDKSIAGDIKNDFEMAISEIIVVKPAEHDQEFFDNVAGKDKIKTEEEYRDFVKNMIEAQLANNSNSYFDYTAEKYFMDKYGDMQLPVAFLKKWLVARNSELTAENIDKEFDEMLPSLKWQLIREAIATKLGVKIDENDLLEYAKMVARQQFAQYGMTNMDDQTVEDTAKRILSNENYRNQMVDQVSNAKLFYSIREAVTLKEETVSLDKFKEIVGAK